MEKETRKSSSPAPKGLVVPSIERRRSSSGVDVGLSASESDSRRGSAATASTSGIDTAGPSRTISGIPQLTIDPGSQSEAETTPTPVKSRVKRSPSPKAKSPSPKKESPLGSRIKEGIRKVRKSLSPKSPKGEEDPEKDPMISPGRSAERKSSKSPDKSPRKSRRFRSKSRSPGKPSREKSVPFMLGDELKYSSTSSDEERLKAGAKSQTKGTDKDPKVSSERSRTRKSSKSPVKSPMKSPSSRSKSRSPGKADKRLSREESEPFILGDELRPSTSTSSGDDRQKAGKSREKDQKKLRKDLKLDLNKDTTGSSTESLVEEMMNYFCFREKVPPQVGRWSQMRVSPDRPCTSPQETDVDPDSSASFEDAGKKPEAATEREMSSAGEVVSKRLGPKDLEETSKGSSAGSESSRRILSKRPMESEAAGGDETRELPDPGPSPKKQPKIVESKVGETESKDEKRERKSDSEVDDDDDDKSKLRP